MNLLVISNLYPPHALGGYELGCRDVVEALRRRGHRVRVLTSVYGVGRAASAGDVHRRLAIDLAERPRSSPAFALSLAAAEVRGGRALGALVAEARPDLVYVWNLRHLPLSLARAAQRRGLPVCYFVSDDWLAHWQTVDRWEQWVSRQPSGRARRALKRWLRGAVERMRPGGPADGLDLRHVEFASRHLKQACLEAGKPVEHARVVPWGIDTRRFSPREGGGVGGPRLLYAGQLVDHKGVHTAIEACDRLVHVHGLAGIELTVAGGSVRPDYRERLQSMVRATGLAERVRFTGALAREQMPALYRAHDVLIFPSIWDEPFSLTLLEAMASGLAVVGTATGGSAEILRHGVNAMVFPPRDAAACARHVQALVTQPELGERLGRQARRTVEHAFDLDRMADAIEEDLQRVVAEAARGAGAPLVSGRLTS